MEFPKEAAVYELTGTDGIYSNTISLNGKELLLNDNDELPEMEGVFVSGKVEIVPGGCTFIVL